MTDRGVRGFDPARLRAARQARRDRAGGAVGEWTQQHVAELLGLKRTNYLLWEQGSRVPSPAALVRLAALLEVEPHELTDVDPDQATLADLRQWAGLTQPAMAEALGVSRSLYAAIERGERRVDGQRLDRLARLLAVPADHVQDASERRI